MNNPTFKQGFDKITRAYFADELNPLSDCACFIGNLLNGNDGWSEGRLFAYSRGTVSKNECEVKYANLCIKKEANGFYTMEEIVRMENNFLGVWFSGRITEQSLFEAMDSTLDLLRTIHESKGEIIDTVPAFQKRQLQTT